MKKEAHTLSAALIALALVGFLPPGVTALPVEPEAPDAGQIAIGKSAYRAYCVSCHGVTAEGDGPEANHLTVPPADFINIDYSVRNGGFPFEEVVKKIDGREKVAAHGSSDMPIWGNVFQQAEGGGDEEEIRQKVTALAHYLWSIQADAED